MQHNNLPHKINLIWRTTSKKQSEYWTLLQHKYHWYVCVHLIYFFYVSSSLMSNAVRANPESRISMAIFFLKCHTIKMQCIFYAYFTNCRILLFAFFDLIPVNLTTTFVTEEKFIILIIHFFLLNNDSIFTLSNFQNFFLTNGARAITLNPVFNALKAKLMITTI